MIKQPQERLGGQLQEAKFALHSETETVRTGRRGGENCLGKADGFVPGDRLCCGGMQLGKFVGKMQILNNWLEGGYN